MIEIKPTLPNCFICPSCGLKDPIVNEIIVQSFYAEADCLCTQCGNEFYQTLPLSHAIDDQVSVQKTNGKVWGGGSKSWFTEAIQKSHAKPCADDIHIEKIIFKKFENVIVLNTLDFLYGHVLLKLYNAQFHLDHQSETGLILIIPKSFNWLVPEGCAEVWEVDLKLHEFMHRYEALHQFISGQFSRFKKIFLSRAYSHPDFTAIDITRFTKIKPFDLQTFSKRRVTVTFVLREDRCWIKHPGYYWLFRLCKRFGLRQRGYQLMARNQNSLVKETIEKIRLELKQVDFFIVGIGTTGSFKGYATDKRSTAIDNTVEHDWCAVYARSHVTIGVHGSNMLLPTALAAGCVEILPEDRYGNIVQDISVRYTDRKQLFFYRFADAFSSPKTVATKALAMIGDFEAFHKNMCVNIYSKRKPVRKNIMHQPEI